MLKLSIVIILFFVYSLSSVNVHAQAPQDQFGADFTGVIDRGDHQLVLPRTGINPLFWSLVGLIPLGLKLKNFKRYSSSKTPLQRWNERTLVHGIDKS